MAVKAGLAISVDLVDPGQFLQLLLDAVGDLSLHFRAGRARPLDGDDGCLDGEGRIFRAAEPLIGEGAAEADDQNQEREELGMPDRPVGKVEPAHLKPR